MATATEMTRLEIAHGIRSAAQRYYPRCPTLRNRCGPCSFALMLCLQGLGEEAMLAWGFYGSKTNRRAHYWVETPDGILDVTAGQFHRAGPAAPLEIAALDDSRYARRKRFRDSAETAEFGIPAFIALDGFAIAVAFSRSLGERKECG